MALDNCESNINISRASACLPSYLVISITAHLNIVDDTGSFSPITSSNLNKLAAYSQSIFGGAMRNRLNEIPANELIKVLW